MKRKEWIEQNLPLLRTLQSAAEESRKLAENSTTEEERERLQQNADALNEAAKQQLYNTYFGKPKR